MNDASISRLVRGVSISLPDAAKEAVEQSVRTLSSELERASTNRSTSAMLGSKKLQNNPARTNMIGDTEAFTTISEMINGTANNFAGFGTLLDNLYAKNKKYFTIIKDYEIMPILIPQINRVLMFLVNECLSPDVQNKQTFAIRYTGTDKNQRLDEEIDQIKREMKLDNMLREVYTNRYKLGREYYIVQDYTQTFDFMLERLRQKSMNESTGDFIDNICAPFIGQINEVSGVVPISAVDTTAPKTGAVDHKDAKSDIHESTLNLDLKDLNIVIERTSAVRMIDESYSRVICESYAGYDHKNAFKQFTLNEATADEGSKIEMIVNDLKKKKLQRCTIVRLDPAKVFQLKVGGKIIGYFYVSDINEGTGNMVNFAQSLKDQLLKTRATNLAAAQQSAEEVIAKELATKILNTFDPNIGINRVEDIDLMHDFIRNNEIYKGNKRITFYYADEIYDMSRSDGSILINAVFFTKLYATLLLNNIVTKVLRGRGRQIHTVKMGASPDVQRYLDNAMASLAMPEHNLGTLHGTFEQIMNPFNGASDIVIPTEDNDEKYITTDYIPGQDIDMNDDFLKFLLNSIVTTFGLDSAVLDATNGNLQFARTLTMESLQISNSIMNEQQDTIDPWTAMCLEVLRIMGGEEMQSALTNGQIEVKFFEPRSLIVQNMIDDINNAKNAAEALADVIPEFNDEDTDKLRSKFVFEYVIKNCNIDVGLIKEILTDVKIDAVVTDELDALIRQLVRDYKENTKEVDAGEQGGDEFSADGGSEGDEYSEEGEGEGDEELTPEEEDLMSAPDEEDEEGEGDDDTL
ncbi:MAG: hypothetical protein NC311_05865 [Muribaculaceae bacterium]|nr:hypothetical protein [Muribaculaceae bacterium]